MTGQIVTVFAAKGGCGKTTLAVNLAVVLADGGERRVCLVDLDLAFGDVASMFAIEPKRTVAHAGTLGAARVAMPVARGLDIVAAPAVPGEAEKVPVPLVGDLLARLARRYDDVVVDTSSQFSAHVLAALDAAHRHVLITTPERPALKNLRLTLDVLDLLGYRRESRSIVFNRSDSKVGLTAEDIESAVHSPIAAELPSSWDVSASINAGVPLAAGQPEHPFSRAVRRFVETQISTSEGKDNARTTP